MCPDNLRGRDTVQMALILCTPTTRVSIATNRFLYRDKQRDLATCSVVVDLLDT